MVCTGLIAKSMTRSKSEGGYGFKDFEIFNTALLAKQFWRLSNSPDSLWARVLKGIYFRDTNVWEANVPRCCSWSWRSLLAGRDFLRRHRSWVIGNGSSVRVVGDRWIHDGKKIFHGGEQVQNLNVVDLINKESNQWDLGKINSIFPPEISKDILAVPIAATPVADKQIWPYTTDGVYTVKSGYKVLIDEGNSNSPSSSSGSDVNKPFWKAIWTAKVPPKIRNFIWRVCNNGIATGSNLYRRQCISDEICGICGMAPETDTHLFTGCSWVKAFWFGSIFQWDLSVASTLTMQDWIFSKIQSFKTTTSEYEDLISMFFFHLWAVWTCRNHFLFDRRSIIPEAVLNYARFSFQEFWEVTHLPTGDSNACPSAPPTTPRWSPPLDGYLKFNVDAAFNPSQNLAAAAVIVRDHNGAMVTGNARRFLCDNVFRAEAKAMLDAVRLTAALGVNNPIFEGDSLSIVNACSGSASPGQALSVVDSIKASLLSLNGYSFKWIPREANTVADLIAGHALKRSLPISWSWLLPVFLRSAILKDILVFQSN